MKLAKLLAPCTVSLYFALLSCSMASAAALVMPQIGEDLAGEPSNTTARHEDNFTQLADRYDIGYLALSAANPDLNPSFPGEGTLVHLPTAYILPSSARRGIVINLAELRLYYYPDNEKSLYTFPIGIGKQGWDTPTGDTRVTQVIHNPSWTPPPSIVAEYKKAGVFLPATIPAGPDNPLGALALRLGLPGYLLHGTNNETGVGLRVSHGCIRLRNRDIATLVSLISADTSVTIINQPYKVGWHKGQLYFEAHRPLDDLHNDAETNKNGIRTAMRTVLEPELEKVNQAANVDQIIELALLEENFFDGMPKIIYSGHSR